jgi:energy-coupling factor transporter ATP-binding protein EcfA2
VGLARSTSKPIFPILVAGTRRHPLLEDVQWVDLTSEGEDSYRRLFAGLRRAGLDPADAFTWNPTRPPYPGLKPFDTEDAAVFFGRENEVERLAQLLQSSLQRVAGRFVAIVGPSGSGKSSLLQWIVLPTFRPGQHPFQNLAHSFVPAFRDRGQSVSSAEMAERLERTPEELIEVASDLAGTVSGEPNVLVVVDQAEELLTLTGPQEQQRFLDLLRAGMSDTSPLWAVATVRSEFLSTSPDRAGLAEVIDDAMVVEPLSRGRLAEVIQRPAQQAGLEFAPGLVERMVDDTTGGDALPLLAYTLRELYQRTGPDRRISLDNYEAAGGVIGALQGRANQLLD